MSRSTSGIRQRASALRARPTLLSVGVLATLGLLLGLTSPVQRTLQPVPDGPMQPGSLVYGSPEGAQAYAAPGGLVVTGRDNFDAPQFEQVARRGGTVLLYLDPIIDADHGRYHELLLDRSACGPAVPRWPGSPRANSYGFLNDFRPGSVLQDKLPCVLETMVRENPHMGGWLADDVGSRSWFPDLDWDALPTWQQRAYRNGAVAITRTFREVADRHGLIFLVNGSWGAGSLEDDGGGWPDPDQHGNALADGAFVEHHDGRSSYFDRYACSAQWASQSATTRGEAVNYTVTYTWAGLVEFARSGCFAYASVQAAYDVVAPWKGFRDLGLPSGRARP